MDRTKIFGRGPPIAMLLLLVACGGSQNVAQAPPVASISAAATTVGSGGTTTLTWTSTNATACTGSDGWTGALSPSGSQMTAALTTSTTFSLTCSGPGGTSSPAAVTVVVAPAATVTLMANPQTVVAGGTSTLTWTSTNATSCTASGGWSGAQATGGTQATAALTTSTTYSLTCTGPGGASAPAAVTIAVGAVTPPATVSLTANPQSVVVGATSTLTWTSTNATSCTASGGWTGAQATSGTQVTAALTTSTTYSLTCTGAGGASAPAAVTIAVGAVAPPATVSLAANPQTVAAGATSTLTWTSTNGTSCTASGGWTGAQATSGTQVTAGLTASTTYSLTCTGAGGASTPAAVTVVVAPVATVTLMASPQSVAAGATSTLTWTSTNATSCTASGGWTGTEPTGGTQVTAALTTSTSYSLTCTGPGGLSAPSAVTVAVVPVPTVTLAANPQLVAAGGTSTLTWTSTNATACTASGAWSGAEPTSGTAGTGALSANATYSLVCSGIGGTSNTASATVTIGYSGPLTLSPQTAAITQSQTLQFATVPTGAAVTWTVDGISNGNATVGSVNASGLYTPGTAAGVHAVIATDAVNSAQSANASVAVTDLTGVYTAHNDVSRDGTNSHEFALTTANVNTTSFGKLFSCVADGAIYAQPLWVANLTVNGAQHNVVFVATAHDGLFAFDADASPCVTLWSVNLIDTAHGGSAGETTVPSGTSGNIVGQSFGDITPEVGVIGTPVIDPASNTLYVISKSVNSAHTVFYQRLHAINLTTGQERTASPITVAAGYTGSGGTVTTFNSQTEAQRSGLALVNGVVYVAWASHEDTGPYFGWIAGYTYNGSAFNLTQVLNVTPDGTEGGIWMSGGAPAADSNNQLYVITGNGTFDATNSGAPNDDYGDSLLKLSSSLTVAQYFTPSDQLTDEQNDQDFGAGGAVVLVDLPAGSPVTHLVMGGGKDSSLYVLNRDNLGGFGDGAAVQQVSMGHGIFCTGAFWNNTFYLAAASGALRAYSLNPAIPQFTLSSSSPTSYPWPGTTPSVSAAGTQQGIVWALDNHLYCTNQSPGCGPTVLHAYDATNVATELWNSAITGNDAAGNAVKFTVPTTANGKVYVGTRGNNTGGAYGSTSSSGELDVYGLKPM
ncbi:MAG TPA: hypothetical protein VK700_00445 [Steroidobacteraceae bacterium]|nr:hypothetical protein [Steroidobacteraceae bacterium]